MDKAGSDTDIEASGYESDKHESEEGQLLDWDEGNTTPSEDVEKTDKNNVKGDLHLEVSSSRKQQEALFDSGYQKSPPAADDSPRSVKDEVIALDFKLTSNEKPKSNILSVFDNLDKVNELDSFRKERKYLNVSSTIPHHEIMKKICQEIAKHPVAGPSRDPRKKHSKKINSPDSDNSSDDVKSIANCILENSLNRIECEDDCKCGDLIQDLIPEEIRAEENPGQEVAVEPAEIVPLVENGDLANNNRDLEGNNYPAENVENQEPLNNNAIDNMEHNNVHIDNNNEVVEVFPEPLPVEEVVELIAEEAAMDEEIAYSSREALYDANSQVDLLEDFDMDSAVAGQVVVIPHGFAIVSCSDNENFVDPVLPSEGNNFPNWLLNIFDEEEPEVPDEDLHDEPHFYCQGDGLGVHPSIVGLHNDADDEGTESGSDGTSSSESASSSSSGSAQFTSAENRSLPDLPASGSRESNLVLVGQGLSVIHPSNGLEDTTEEEERSDIFENAEESESNLLTTSCMK